MTVNRIAVDGLWRCLCPSFDSIALSQSTLPHPRPPKPFPRSKARAAFPKCLHARDFSSSIRVRNHAKGSRPRYAVTKEGAPNFLSIEKGWGRHIPKAGGLEGHDTPQELTGALKASNPPGNISDGSGGNLFWGSGQSEVGDDELARKLQETCQRTESWDSKGHARRMESPNTLGRDETRSSKVAQIETARNAKYVNARDTKFSSLESEKAEQAKWSSGFLSHSQSTHDQTQISSLDNKRQKLERQFPIRPLWVPHREYGATIASNPRAKDPSPGDDVLSERPLKPSNGRAAFFQAVREQRQQHAAQLPRSRRQAPNEPHSQMQPVQPQRQDLEEKPVVLWEQEQWDKDEIDNLYDRLRSYRTQEGNYGRVVGLVEYLIKNRADSPALIHYDSLIRANADAENGSAECVRTLLEEMKEEGIRGDSGLYHGALQALAIHPDYALRADIMQEMKERWFGLSPEGWHSLVVGLLRDRQIEMALDKLEQMHSDDILIQPWLYDIFTYMLCELGELDEAYKLVRHRHENSRLGITQDHWHYLLDQFSNAYHYEATKDIWDSHVRNAELIPSDGTCVSVLNLAARNADPALATSVIQILSARQTPLSPFHYEALVAAYTGIKDIKTAFRVLAIMEKAGHDPSASSTRPLYLHLSTSEQLCHEAWTIVNRLHKDGHTIPITAVNVIIESLTKTRQFDAAFEYYKRLHEICPCGPNTETINVTLQGLGYTKKGGKARAMFLASEMQALDIKPDILTYDRLILICLKDDDYEDAFRYLEEMEEVGRESVENNHMGWWMRQGTAGIMVRVCAVSGDDRAWKIMQGMKERGMSVNKLNEWVVSNWKKSKSMGQSSNAGC